MKKKLLTDSQYEVCMRALGYAYDEDLCVFFNGDSVFFMNVSDDVNEVEDLMKINEKGQPTYMAKVLCDFMNIGAELTIGEGAIDGYGKKYKKGLYCTNYRKLYCDRMKSRSK